MVQPQEADDLLTLAEAEHRFGVKRSTLYRYIQRGDLPTYRRAMDRRVYVRVADLEALRRYRRSAPPGELTMAAVERARAFQRRVFGNRRLAVPSSDLIDEGRRERGEALP